MQLNREEYLSKVAGCWMGKNIGGTVGAPFEWLRQVNDISFYTQELKGEPLPNDDLDIQLLWLIAMEREGVRLNAGLLGEYWLNYVAPHWAEYGNGKINMRNGLVPPLSGTVNNTFKDSCGSFIRSEIWACVCPGAPERAAKYALEDSAIDHGNGEGTFAEVFTVVLESAAFVEKDIRKLINIGLSFIPEDCAVAGAVRLAVDCHDKGLPWQEARDEILKHYRGMAPFGSREHISAADVEKGFFDGVLGFDVPSNMGILIIGLLYGENDFGKTLCIAVNCGEDTDCTAATAGSILGIMNGIDYIPEEWIQPIGRSIKTLVLNLGDLYGVPKDIDDLTNRTLALAYKVIDAFNLPVKLSDGETDLSGDLQSVLANGKEQLYSNLGRAVFTFDIAEVAVDYSCDPYIGENESKTVTLTITNRFGSQHNFNMKVYTDEGVTANPRYGQVYIGTYANDCCKAVSVTFTAETLRQSTRAVVELTIPGRHSALLVPIVLLNGAYKNTNLS